MDRYGSSRLGKSQDWKRQRRCPPELLGDCRSPNWSALALLNFGNYGGRGGTPYAGGGSPYRLILIADCADDNGRWRDYQLGLPNDAPGPVPPSMVAESLNPESDLKPSRDWGNNVGDHLSPGIYSGAQYHTQQSFFVKTGGGPSRPIAVSINGEEYSSLKIDMYNTNLKQTVYVNNELGPQMPPGVPCPNT